MPVTAFSLPLTFTGGERPATPRVPVAVPIDLTALLAGAGRRALPDLSSLRVEANGRPVPAQFSPSDDFDPELRARGVLTLLAGGSLRGTLHFVATDDLKAARLPYPPRSYRHAGPDGRIAPPAYWRRMQLVPQPGGRLAVEEEGRLVTTYHFAREEPKPYFFPLIGPAGRGLVRLGHPHDPGDTHSHHHGLWVGHHSVNGISFWDERQGGRLLHQQFERLEDGPVCGRFRARVLWEAPGGRPVLTERREVAIYAAGAHDGPRLLDFTLRLEGAGGAAAELGKTSFGFLAVRVAKSMGAFDGGGLILNSEGGINEPGIFWKPARWCDYSGPVTEDAWNGIAFLDHPENPHHPTPWHVRPDGWMGAAFNTDHPRRIPAGETLTLRYRLYVHAGDARQAQVERAWRDYAAPPTATLGTLRAG
jgi:hypothetical protein